VGAGNTIGAIGSVAAAAVLARAKADVAGVLSAIAASDVDANRRTLTRGVGSAPPSRTPSAARGTDCSLGVGAITVLDASGDGVEATTFTAGESPAGSLDEVAATIETLEAAEESADAGTEVCAPPELP
jgi:hypothetical protein